MQKNNSPESPRFRAGKLNRPTTYLFLSAAVLLLKGQIDFFSGRVGLGLSLAGAGIGLLLLSLAGDQRIYNSGRKMRCWLEIVIKYIEQTKLFASGKDFQENQKSPQDFPAAAKEEIETKDRGNQPLPGIPAIEVILPKKLLLGVGLALLLISQPFLFMEKFLMALILVLPGLLLLGCALFMKGERLVLGRLEALLKGLIIALPGCALIVTGNIFLIKFVHTNLVKEIIGLALNAIGIFLLLALLPRRFPDPEPQTLHPLDQGWGGASKPINLWIKAGLALSAFLLFFWVCPNNPAGADSWISLLPVVAGMGALLLSFPWLKYSSDELPLNNLAGFGLRIFRMLALVLAIFIAYRGQLLISRDQLFPGLYYFGLAVIVLLLAFREPENNLTDKFPETPLKWYWEFLGVAAVLAIGIWLRVRLLDIMPYGIECDEAAGGVHALDILEGRFNSLTAHPIGQPLFMLLPKVLAIHFFDYGNLGMRFMAMLFGSLGILAFYLMGRYFFGPRIALAAAALFALSRWHIHFSRFGFSNTLFILLLMLGFYFLVKGLSSRSKWHFVFSGAAFSISLQTETAARLVPFICMGLLGYFCVVQRHFFRRNWKPLLALMLGVWLTGAGICLYWTDNSHILLRRLGEVSVFSEDPNAPRDPVKGFINSAKMTLTQMNWHGDYRGRHNGGLSGEPVLDFWTSIMFVLGFGFSLYYWKRLRYFLPLIWFFGFMSASVFALEAPQSHRVFGMFPTLFLFIGIFLDRVRRILRVTLGKAGTLAGVLAFALILIPIAKTNYQKYFNTFPGFDTACTAAARYMGDQWPEAEHFVMTAYLWWGHPPFRLYAGKVSGHLAYAVSEVVPVRLDTEKDIVYDLILEYPDLIPALQYFYPKGIFKEEIHEKFGSQFKAWAVRNKDIMETRGLSARYWNNSQWQGTPALVRKDTALNLVFDEATWPLPGAGSIAWTGTIYIPREGQFTFYLYGTDQVEVEIGSKLKLRTAGGQESRKTIWLAGGLHRFRGRAKNADSHSRIQLSWSCQEECNYNISQQEYKTAFIKQVIPETNFFTYPEPAGLLGTFYHTDNWQGCPLQQKVEPALLFVWMHTPYGYSDPLSADWRGWIKIPRAGHYQFAVNAAGYGEVEIDGKAVLCSGSPPAGWQPRGYSENPVWLSEGRHPIVVRWSRKNGSMFKFWWTPPGGSKEIVPPGVLSPADE